MSYIKLVPVISSM